MRRGCRRRADRRTAPTWALWRPLSGDRRDGDSQRIAARARDVQGGAHPRPRRADELHPRAVRAGMPADPEQEEPVRTGDNASGRWATSRRVFAESASGSRPGSRASMFSHRASAAPSAGRSRVGGAMISSRPVSRRSRAPRTALRPTDGEAGRQSPPPSPAGGNVGRA
jgi:hypothetical protein